MSTLPHAAMKLPPVCARCKTPIPTGAPNALCPRCLMGGAMADPGDTPFSDSPPPFGSIQGLQIAGDYELLEEIGRGAMGIVFKAWQKSLERIVAVKVAIITLRGLRPEDVEEIRQIVSQEAKLAAKVAHVNIVPIHEVNTLTRDEAEQIVLSIQSEVGTAPIPVQDLEGIPFFSMDYVKGANLNRLPERNPLDPRQAAEYVQVVARATHFAHESHLIHLDLKPSNILRGEDGRLYVTDFGIAQRLDPNFGASAGGAGTPGYMAPEQVTKGRVDARTDVYGLGAVLYFLLTGRPPFSASMDTGYLHQVCTVAPTSPRLLNPAISRDLDAVCLKCLKKAPAERYHTAEALADDLQRFLDHRPVKARSHGPVETARMWCQRNALLVKAAAIVLVTLCIGLYQWRRAVTQGDVATHNALMRDLNEVRDYFSENHAQRAMAALASMLRKDPANRVAAERVLNAVAEHSFLVPLAPPFSNSVHLGQFSPDGRMFLAGTNAEGGVVQVWEPDGTVWAEFAHGSEEIQAMDVAADGSLVASGSESWLRVWNVAQRQMVLACTNSAGPLRQIRLLPGGGIAAVSTRKVVSMPVDQPTVSQEFNAEEEQIVCAASAASGGMAATAHYDGTLRIWSLVSGQCSKKISSGHTNIIRDLEFSPDARRLVSAAADGTARLWDLETGRQVGATLKHQAPVYVVGFDPRGQRMITGTRDGKLSLWDAENGTPLGALLAQPEALRAVRFSQEGQIIATVSDSGALRLWNASHEIPVPLTEPASFPDRVARVEIAPGRNGRNLTLLALFEPRGAMLLTATPLQPVAQLNSELPPPQSPRLSDRELKALAAEQGAEAITYALSPDGNVVATVWDRTVRLLKRKDHTLLTKALPHDHVVNWVSFSPDSLRLATSTAGQTFQVWDVGTGFPLTGKLHAGSRIHNVWFAGDGSAVIAGNVWLFRIHRVSTPAPAWLPELAEAVVGLRFHAQMDGKPVQEQVPGEAYLVLRQKLGESSATDPFTQWAKPFLGLDKKGQSSTNVVQP